MRQHQLVTEWFPTAELRTYHRNPRRGDTTRIAQSLTVNGQYKPIVVNRRTHTGRPLEVLAGNHTLIASRDLGWAEIAGVTVDVDEDQAARIVAADNRTSDLGEYDDRLLAELLASLPDLDGTGYDPGDLADLEEALAALAEGAGEWQPPPPALSLVERFGVPPFTVLDTRQGYWQTRKKAWLGLGIESEKGRGSNLDDGTAAAAAFTPGSGRGVGEWREAEAAAKAKHQRGLLFPSGSRQDPSFYDKKRAVEIRLGRDLTTAEFERDHYRGMVAGQRISSGTSIFDPVLCELAYRWYCPLGGVVVDPFAGGSVRGVVAAALGRRYLGGELRAEQVEENRKQWADIEPRLATVPGLDDTPTPEPVWVSGDSRRLRESLGEQAAPADLLFTCPPYADLEVYSDDPADLSTLDYPAFLEGYRECLAEGVALLQPDSFAVVVVTEVRGKKGDGLYRGFVPDTIRLMADLGLGYHSEYVLVNMVGSAAAAAPRQFTASRKPVRLHQNALIFVRGDPRRAAERCAIDPARDLPDPDAPEPEAAGGE